MKRILISILFIINIGMGNLLSAQAPEEMAIPQRRDTKDDTNTISIWLNRHLIQKGAQSIPALMDTLEKAGVDIILLNTWFHGYVIYPGSSYAKQHPDFTGWDPVQILITEAHHRGIKIYAWTEYGFYVHYNETGDPNDLGPILSTKPSWAAMDSTGNIPLTNIKEGYSHYSLCPANPETQEFLLNLFSEMMTRYPFDGINLDRIRYPNNTYCYDRYCRYAFEKEHFLDPLFIPPRDINHQDEWKKWRISQLNHFMHRLSDSLRQKRPEIIISSAVVPSGMINDKMQDWPSWTIQGYLDIPIPMAYGKSELVKKEIIKIRELIGNRTFSIGIDITQSPENIKKILEDLEIAGVNRITLWGDDKIEQFIQIQNQE